MEVNKHTILLVEDEESLRNALKLNLKMEGYEVRTAETGSEALKAFKEEYFDCV
jgi:two-component system alkaline phosphatase synthesis response regulator PhoP